MSKGKLIVLEGLDGSGKATQAKLLAEHLAAQGVPVQKITFPDYASDSSADPRLHQTTLLMWSNYSQQQVDLGTIAAYDISPVMMNLYGLEQPLYFQLLNRQLQVADRANTRGTVMNLDGTTTQTPSSLQESWSQKHWLLQYDLMFGKGYALSRMGMESLNSTQTDE